MCGIGEGEKKKYKKDIKNKSKTKRIVNMNYSGQVDRASPTFKFAEN